MGAHGGPNLAEDGLVFYYDTDNGKSYKGEPTTNLNTLTLSDSGTDGSGQGSVGTRTILSPNHVRIVDVNSNTRQSHLIQGLTGGTTYTVSIEFKKLSGTPTFRFQIQDYNGGSYLRTVKFTNTAETGLVDVEGWQTASWTFTLGADANAVRIWYQDGADYTTYTHSFELRNPQLEAKSHPTPYTAPGTTRSATESLYDFISDSALDVSNVSFDSNADITFDGTNDHIVLSSSIRSIFSSGPNCVELILYKSSADQFNMVPFDVDITRWNLNYNMYVANQWSFDFYDGTEHVIAAGNYDDNYVHFVLQQLSDGTMEIYANGELKGSEAAGSIAPNGNSARIGSRTNGSYYFKGELPLVKIYNRALTAEEVQNNFNGIRSRFGI